MYVLVGVKPQENIVHSEHGLKKKENPPTDAHLGEIASFMESFLYFKWFSAGCKAEKDSCKLFFSSR